MEASTGEAKTQELSLWNPKIIFAQNNHKAVGLAQLQDILEVLNKRR